MEAAISDIALKFKNFVANKISNPKSEKLPKYSIKNLEYRLERFFKKEKKFFKNKLLIYYNFNKNLVDMPSIPYYLSLFYSNLYYVANSAANNEWEEIVDIYEKIREKNPSYKNARLTEKKPAYDRRYMLIITYYILIIFVYIASLFFYKLLSQGFYYIIDILNVGNDENSTFLLFLLYTFFIMGFYYGGIPFIITFIIYTVKFIFFVLRVLYYIIYYFFKLLFTIFTILGSALATAGNSMTGGSINNQNKKYKNRKKNKKYNNFIGGDAFDDIVDVTNDIGDTVNDIGDAINGAFDKISIEFFINIIEKFFEVITPTPKGIKGLLENECKSTSNIEKMLAKHNTQRNTEEPTNISKKIKNSIKNILPESVQNNVFVKCMYKETPKEPPVCDNS